VKQWGAVACKQLCTIHRTVGFRGNTKKLHSRGTTRRRQCARKRPQQHQGQSNTRCDLGTDTFIYDLAIAVSLQLFFLYYGAIFAPLLALIICAVQDTDPCLKTEDPKSSIVVNMGIHVKRKSIQSISLSFVH
jgi:hypothetical protein